MEIKTVRLTREQLDTGKIAAKARYEYNRFTPDRAGWTGGKCPVNEYRGVLGEIAGMQYLGYDWHDLVLYSVDPEDFKRPDYQDWDFKTGSRIYKTDIAKGVHKFLWVTPYETTRTFNCGYDTCTNRTHYSQSGLVEIRGWTTTDDMELFEDFGNYYKPAGKSFRSAVLL